MRCRLLQPLASGRAKAAEEAEEAEETGEQGAALDQPSQTAKSCMAAWLDATEAREAEAAAAAGDAGQGATLRTTRTAAEGVGEEEGLATVRLGNLESLDSLDLGSLDVEEEGGTLRAEVGRGEAARGGEAEAVTRRSSGSCGYPSEAAACLPPDSSAPPDPPDSHTSTASTASTAATVSAASTSAASAIPATATPSHHASAAPPPPPNRPPRPPRPPPAPPASVSGAGAAHTPRTSRALSTASSLFASLGAMEYVRIASHALDHTEDREAKGGDLSHLGHPLPGQPPSEGGTLHKLRAPPSRPPTDLAYGETAEMAQVRAWHGTCNMHGTYSCHAHPLAMLHSLTRRSSLWRCMNVPVAQ